MVHLKQKNLTIRITTKPAYTAKLNAHINQLKLKHIILGSMLWDSLMANFHLDIIGNEM